MRPIVFLPGVLRMPYQLANVADLGEILPFPGQGLPVLPVMDLAGLTDAVRPLVPPDALVVGESFGGLIALGLPNPVVAIDPPLSMAKQAAVRAELLKAANAVSRPALTDLMARVFGFHLDGRVEPREYYHLLHRPQTTVIAAATAISGPFASTLDEADHAEIQRAGCRLVYIDGSHNLINVNPEAVRAVVLRTRDAVQCVGEANGAG
jgi:hypothetical protein